MEFEAVQIYLGSRGFSNNEVVHKGLALFHKLMYRRCFMDTVRCIILSCSDGGFYFSGTLLGF